MKLCFCGSGLERRALIDARGIFCTYVCDKCEKIRAGFDAARTRGAIADRRGLTGPPTIGDDELWITVIRRLRDADHRRLVLDERDERKAKRAKRVAA